jgi:sulfur-carrier protein
VSVQVHLPTVLRVHAGGVKTLSAEGTTVGEVLDGLVATHPGLSGQILNGDGTLHKFVNVYVNDDDVRYLSALDTPVTAGDEVSILPAVAGGALGPATGTARS